MLEFSEQIRHLLFHLFHLADKGVGTPAHGGGPGHEVRVRRRADPDRKKAGIAETVPDQGKQLAFIADRTVGQEDHLPDTVMIVSAVKCHT